MHEGFRTKFSQFFLYLCYDMLLLKKNQDSELTGNPVGFDSFASLKKIATLTAVSFDCLDLEG